MLARLRSLLFVAWMGLTVVPYALAVLVSSVFIRGDTLYWICVAWVRVVIAGARTICGVHWRVQGMDRLPSADRLAPLILAPKHQSTWETFALPTLMSHPLAYVFKRELLHIPFFGWAIGRRRHDPHRPQQAQRGLGQGGGAGPGPARARALGDHVSRGHAHAARRARHVQERRHTARHGHRHARGADRRHVGALLAAQESAAAARRDRHFDRHADPVGWAVSLRN